MKRKQRTGLIVASWLVVSAASALPTTASAQTSDEWRWRAVIYGYFPDIGGSSSFPVRTGGSNIDVDASTILNNLKFVFMGTLEGRKGRWGFATDLIYLDVGGSKSGTRDLTVGGVTLPAGVTANANLDIKATIWTLGATYGLIDERDASLDVVGGARMLSLKEKLSWDFSADLGPLQPSRSGDSQLKNTNWDAIIGVKGRLAFGADRAWFVPYYADVGTGDSDLTWQLFGGVGYAFSWGEVLAGWRYLDYKFKSGSLIQDANLNGPVVGVAFRW